MLYLRAMKRIFLLSVFAFMCFGATAQNNEKVVHSPSVVVSSDSEEGLLEHPSIEEMKDARRKGVKSTPGDKARQEKRWRPILELFGDLFRALGKE